MTMGAPFQLHEEVAVGGYTYYIHLRGVYVDVQRHRDFDRKTPYAAGIWQPVGGYVLWSGEHDATSPISWRVADKIDTRLRVRTGWCGFSGGMVECARDVMHDLAQARGRSSVFFERFSRG